MSVNEAIKILAIIIDNMITNKRIDDELYNKLEDIIFDDIEQKVENE